MLNTPTLDLDRERAMRVRSMTRCYDDLCTMPRDGLSDVDIRIAQRTIWSLKRLIKSVGSL
jgi:hypothetical protein